MHLLWTVVLSGLIPISITYDNASSIMLTDSLPMNISVVLVNYIMDEYIESILVLTVLRNFTFNGSRLECSSGDLDNVTASVFVNSTGK